MSALLEQAQARLRVLERVEIDSVPDGVILTRGCDLTPKAIEWLWQHWLALGKLHILAGPPGQGKTTIAIACGSTVTIGGRWPDGSRCTVGNVLIWSGEDDPADTLLPRLIAAGADPSKVYFVTGSRIGGQALPFDPARDLVQLTAQAQSIGDVRLLIVDPVVSAVAGDSHKNTEVRRALQPLVDLGAYLNAAVLGISHFSKGTTGRDPTERVTGSVAFGAVARVVMVAAKVKNEDGDEDRRVLARAKSNIGPDDGGFEYGLEQVEALPGISASRVLWGKAIDGTARELLTDPDEEGRSDETNSATDDAADALVRIIGLDTVPSRDVVAQLKSERFSEKVIRSARERIGVVVKRSGFGKDMMSYWKLPDGIKVPADDVTCAQSGPVVPIDAQPAEWARLGTTVETGHDCTPDYSGEVEVTIIDTVVQTAASSDADVELM